MDVVTIEGKALDELLSLLGTAQMGRGVYRLRVANEDGAVMLKVNEEMWTAPLGRCSGRAPVRMVGGSWTVACGCGWARHGVRSLAEATRAAHAHEAAAA